MTDLNAKIVQIEAFAPSSVIRLLTLLLVICTVPLRSTPPSALS